MTEVTFKHAELVYVKMGKFTFYLDNTTGEGICERWVEDGDEISDHSYLMSEYELWHGIDFGSGTIVM